VLNDGQNQYLYDAEGRICAVASTPMPGMTAMTGYLYDAAGTRVAKGSISTWSCDPAANGFQTTNDYILGLSGEQLTEMGVDTRAGSNASTLAWQHTNVWAGGKLLATYDADGLHFHLADPLGTRRVQANVLGQIEETCQSLPFGDALNCVLTSSLATADDATEHHFTGKERDNESGNDYFGARYYASSMGRFMSPDWSAKQEPVPYAKLDNPQSLNLYAYVMNNPMTRFDADGHDFWDKVLNTMQGKGWVDTQRAPLATPSSAPGLTGAAKKDFLSGLDSMKVGNKTVGQLAQTLHNESKGLTGGKPGELAKGKTAEANAILNNAEKAKPNAMAPSTGTAPAGDKQIMEEAVYNRATGGDDPVEGRTYFGNSAQDLGSRPVGNGRQSVYDSFGTFTWGNNAPQYIYIYNDPGK
jgi:RHS repeat-associated protein